MISEPTMIAENVVMVWTDFAVNVMSRGQNEAMAWDNLDANIAELDGI